MLTKTKSNYRPAPAGPSLARVCLGCVVLLLFTAATATAQTDRVRTTKGAKTGEITKTSRDAITLTVGSQTEQIPVNTIRSVQFAGEPAELTQARLNARNGGYRRAAEALAKIDTASLRGKALLEQEVAFYRAFCLGKLALLGEGDLKAADAALFGFARKNQQSYHFYRVSEVLGEIRSARGDYTQAERMYGVLARAPFPEYQTRARVLVGRSLQAQNKHTEAVRIFDQALAGPADDSSASKAQRLAAQLGKAVSLGATGRGDEGVAIVEQVLRDADPADDALLATAYNALGGCHLQAGKKKAALFAFLHVDLLFAAQREAHAEALFHLAELWEETGKPQEARLARRRLQEDYAGSTWARQR